MSFIGTVTDGRIVLPPEANFPTGTRVRIETIGEQPVCDCLADAMKEIIGAIDDLPTDLARNHDHYIHGAAKK